MYQMSKELIDLIMKANELSPEEQLYLISHLAGNLRRCEIKCKPRRDITELKGLAPNLLGGMDAQEYVTRIRSGEFPELEIEAKLEEKNSET
ncbi:MAG: hypothetical protein SXA11_10540 [Cyanobacteriota bacterium]|nr:hypothetical protein [Cyanobacteriota bacterium]